MVAINKLCLSFEVNCKKSHFLNGIIQQVVHLKVFGFENSLRFMYVTVTVKNQLKNSKFV